MLILVKIAKKKRVLLHAKHRIIKFLMFAPFPALENLSFLKWEKKILIKRLFVNKNKGKLNLLISNI
jgi:hypothetical protein